jgi:hypothetical protein
MILDRTCIKCGTDFQLKPTNKSSNICLICKREYQKQYENRTSKVKVDGKKENYPMNEEHKKRKFKQIQRELCQIEDRAEWIAYMKNKLDTLDPLILIWIYDRRDQESLSEERERRTYIKDEYQDTRSTHKSKSWFD